MPILPLLAVHDADRATGFYRIAFGAVERERLTEPDHRISHCELQVGDSTFFVADEFPEHNVSADTLGGSPVILWLPVQDLASTFARAIEAGATPLRPIGDGPNGPLAKIRDPFGHVWFLAQIEADASEPKSA